MTLCRCELQSLQRKEGPEDLPKVGAYPYGRHQPRTYEGKSTKDQPPKFSHCNPPFVAGRDPHRGKKQSQARDVLVPQEVTPTLLRMSQFRDWASAGHRHYDKLRVVLLSFGKMFDHQRLFGPLHMDWWTMVEHAMPHRNSPLEPFCATQQHRKVPALVTVVPSFIPLLSQCSLAQNILDIPQ